MREIILDTETTGLRPSEDHKIIEIAAIEIETNRSIVCLVGHNIVNHHETPNLFQILQDVNVRMISYGGSNNNISLLINTNDKLETLRKLNRYVFEPAEVF